MVAVLNDTVGTLMALAHEDGNCEIGIILGKRAALTGFSMGNARFLCISGTGTNACYVEDADRAPKLRSYLDKAGFNHVSDFRISASVGVLHRTLRFR